MGLSLVTGPELDPVSLSEAKAHCRVAIDDDDGLIAGYILAARQHIEEITGRSFIYKTYDLTIDGDWPWIIDPESRAHLQVIELQRPPLISVTSISYVDAAGATQTLASSQYIVDASTQIGRIYPAYDVTWPQVRSQPRAITVRFAAGYGTTPGDVPEPIRQAILLLIGHWYENRETVGSLTAEMPFAVSALISSFRVFY